jgi:hypothetical protein
MHLSKDAGFACLSKTARVELKYRPKPEVAAKSFGQSDRSTRAVVVGETTKTDGKVSICVLKYLKLNIFHAYFTKKMPQTKQRLLYKFYPNPSGLG